MLGIIILRSPIFKSDANKYLAYAVGGLSFSLLSLAVELTKAYEQNLLLLIIDALSSGALFPVLIFLFIANQVDHPFRSSKKRWWLFAPHLFSVFLSLLNIAIDFAAISFFAQTLFDFIETALFLLILPFIPSVLLYAYSFIKYSENSKEKQWLTQLWLLVFIIMSAYALSTLLAVLSFIDIGSVIIMISLGAAFMIHWITYVGIFKFRLSKDQEEIRALINKRKSDTTKPNVFSSPSPTTIDKKQVPPLTEQNSYFKKLETLCIEEQIYLDNTLDRAQVAEMLGISPGYVSQLINTITGDNFSTYINRYRVEAVKEMIANTEFDNYSLLAIGLESGFSSKTTFHTAFKKLTGMTPNMYRKAHK